LLNLQHDIKMTIYFRLIKSSSSTDYTNIESVKTRTIFGFNLDPDILVKRNFLDIELVNRGFMIGFTLCTSLIILKWVDILRRNTMWSHYPLEYLLNPKIMNQNNI